MNLLLSLCHSVIWSSVKSQGNIWIFVLCFRYSGSKISGGFSSSYQRRNLFLPSLTWPHSWNIWCCPVVSLMDQDVHTILCPICQSQSCPTIWCQMGKKDFYMWITQTLVQDTYQCIADQLFDFSLFDFQGEVSTDAEETTPRCHWIGIGTNQKIKARDIGWATTRRRAVKDIQNALE